MEDNLNDRSNMAVDSDADDEMATDATDTGVRHGIDNNPNNDAEKGAVLGGIGGAVTGAVAGALTGPVGAVVGGVIGAAAGAVGSGLGVAAVDQVDNDNTVTGLGETNRTDVDNRTDQERRAEEENRNVDRNSDRFNDATYTERADAYGSPSAGAYDRTSATDTDLSAATGTDFSAADTGTVDTFGADPGSAYAGDIGANAQATDIPDTAPVGRDYSGTDVRDSGSFVEPNVSDVSAVSDTSSVSDISNVSDISDVSDTSDVYSGAGTTGSTMGDRYAESGTGMDRYGEPVASDSTSMAPPTGSTMGSAGTAGTYSGADVQGSNRGGYAMDNDVETADEDEFSMTGHKGGEWFNPEMEAHHIPIEVGDNEDMEDDVTDADRNFNDRMGKNW